MVVMTVASTAEQKVVETAELMVEYWVCYLVAPMVAYLAACLVEPRADSMAGTWVLRLVVRWVPKSAA